MTVESSQQYVAYETDGVTLAYAIPFYFLDGSHIYAQFIASESSETVTSITKDTDFTVTGAGNEDGGTLTLTVAKPRGFTLYIERQVPVTQETAYQQNSAFPAKTTETALDKLTMIVQQLTSSFARSIRYPVSEYDTDGTLPVKAERGATIFGFDSGGKQTLLPIPASVGAGDLRNESWTDGIDYTAGTSNSVSLSRSYGSKANLGTVVMAGISQDPNSYSLGADGMTLQFDAVIPPNIPRIWCVGGTTLSLSQPATESVVDASIAPGTALANRLTECNVKDPQFGARGDGITDDTVAINKALSFMALNGGVLTIPQGQYLVAGAGLMLDQSLLTFGSLTHVSIRGAGSGATQILYTGTGTALTYKGAQPNGVNSFCTIQGIKFEGVSQTAGTGITLLDASGLTMRDVISTFFGTGINGTDVLQSTFENCVFGANSAGGFFQFSNFSPPNALTFINCEIVSNLNTGLGFSDPTTAVFIGGAVQGNGIGGASPTKYGIAIVIGNSGNPGLNGAAAASFFGTYFEQNVGNGDIWFAAGSLDGATSVMAIACTFNRISNVNFVTNNIRMDVGASSKAKLVSIGNGFQGFGAYVADASRKYVAVNATGGAVYDITDLGNLYGSSVEKPVFIGPTKGDIAMVSQYCAFDGTQATPPTTGGFNTALITKNGTGDYTVTFEKAGSKSVYPVNFSLGGAGFCEIVSTSMANYRFKTLNPSQVATDFAYVSASCFGNGDVT